MNKKFLSGMIFGLSLGIGVGIATPMIADDAMNITIKKSSGSKKMPSTVSAPSEEKGLDTAELKNIKSTLDSINKKLEKHSDQYERMIEHLSNIEKSNKITAFDEKK
jgi:hypothetical protein